MEHNWQDLLDTECPNVIWKKLYETILLYINMQCPMKEFKIKKTKEPWISPELLEFIKDKDKALRKAKRSHLDMDWEIARRLRNGCLHWVRNCKSEFIKNELNTNQDDSKKFWNTVKTVIPDNKGKNTKFHLLDPKKQDYVSPEKLPNFINNFFADIGPNLAKKSKGDWTYQGVRSNVVLHDIVINDDEICKNINVNKSSSIKNLSSRILKDAFIAIPHVIRYMLQKSIDSCIFPNEWKIANIIPLQKGGDKSSVSNLRPVSLLPLPSKILERVIHDRVMFHIERNNLLEINQGGFRKNHSTMSTIAKFTNDLFTGINNNKSTIACFIDLAKVFDTVNHKILIKKLEYLGITGNLNKLFQNYLSNRKQRTSIENRSSDFRNITCGVPQGSILGPMLFLIYVNDLSSYIEKCKYQLYADDTVIYCTSDDLNASTQYLQADLEKITKWCKGNALTVNIKKSKYVCFGMKSQTRKIQNHTL